MWDIIASGVSHNDKKSPMSREVCVQLALTVVDSSTGTQSDVLVDLDDDATVDELASELLVLVRGAPSNVASLTARRDRAPGVLR